MKNSKLLKYFLAVVVILSSCLNFRACAMNPSDAPEKQGEIKYGPRKRPTAIETVCNNGKKTQTYSLTTKDINEAIIAAGKRRKAKEKKAQSDSPLMPTGTISFTSSKKETKDIEVYRVDNKEDKRKLRHIMQEFHDESVESRKNGTARPEPIAIQRGGDLSILRPGFDVALAPLRKERKLMQHLPLLLMEMR